jgi:ubiquinone/menaquinone biosynthesis C-methylase UbiE
MMIRVNPKLYTEKYYLTDCTGFEEFKRSNGNELEPRLIELTKYLQIYAGEKMLDIGCGRGEMVLFFAKKRVISVGIDYSKDSLKLAKELKKKQPKEVQEFMKFYLMDAKKIKFNKNTFDAILMADIVEHLYPYELEKVFKEVKRVLKPNGKLIVHTAPNKLFNEKGYKYYSFPVSTFIVNLWNRILKKKYPNMVHPEKMRTESHNIMHINEQTYFSLNNLFKKFNLKGKIISSNITVKKEKISIKDSFFNFLVFLHPFSKRFPLNIFLGSDFIAILENKK